MNNNVLKQVYGYFLVCHERNNLVNSLIVAISWVCVQHFTLIITPDFG